MRIVETLVEHLTISGSLDELAKVHDWAKTFLARAEISDALHYNVLLAVSEAVTNAIRHGSKEIKDELVHISAWYEGKMLTVSVKDHGEGFIPDDLPDPTQKEHLLTKGGRGVFLLKSLTHYVRFDCSNQGTTVTFKFALD